MQFVSYRASRAMEKALTFIKGKPDWNIIIISRNHKFGIVEKVVHDFRACPGAVSIEERQGGIPVEESDDRLDS